MTDQTTHTYPDPLAIAIRAMDGRMIVPVAEAMRIAGLPHSQASIHDARINGRLPMREIKLGARYWVTAAALADALLRGENGRIDGYKESDNEPPRRKPGRPRKAAGGAS